MSYETHVDEVISNQSNKTKEVYQDILDSYLDGMIEETEQWDTLNCIYYDASILDWDLACKLHIMTDQYLVYGISRGIYYHKFIPRYEFEEKLHENRVPSQ
jgi:hypothetical protein